MEDHMSRLFDLIESKSFVELNDHERTFVLNEMTEEEYSFQRRIHAAAMELEFEDAEPHPLVLPAKQKPLLTRTIPLYQVLIGAAVLLVGFFAFPTRSGSTIDIQFLENPIQVSLTNAPGEIKFIHDTIVEKLDLRSPMQVMHDTITLVQTVFVRNETRMLEATNTLNSIPLDKNLLETKTLSAKDDGSVKLLPNLNDFSSMK